MSNVPTYPVRSTGRKESFGWRWNRFLFSVKLIERAVQLELQRQADLENRYHRKADFIYEEYDGSERQQEFEKLDWSFFRRLGIPERLDREVQKFPIITEHVDNIVVTMAIQKSQETADLLTNDKVEQMMISICPETLLDWNVGRRYLLHELMHVADMLDPSFQYERRRLGTSPSDEEIVRQRFAILWRIYVDGRLDQQGETPLLHLGEYEREFNRLFRRVPVDHRKKILEELWSGNSWTYRKLIALAGDSSYVSGLAGGTSEVVADWAAGLALANSCPICHCRMYEAVRLDEKSDFNRIHRIQKEFPEWSPDQGICSRCLEYSELV